MKSLTHESEQGIVIYAAGPERSQVVAVLELSGQNVTRNKTAIRHAIQQNLMDSDLATGASVHDSLRALVNQANDVVRESRQPSDQNYGSIIVAVPRPAAHAITIAAYGDCHAWRISKNNPQQEKKITQLDSGRLVAYLGSTNINERFLYFMDVPDLGNEDYLVLATDSLARPEIEHLTPKSATAHRFVRDLRRNHAPGAITVLGTAAKLRADQRRDRFAQVRKAFLNSAFVVVALIVAVFGIKYLGTLIPWPTPTPSTAPTATQPTPTATIAPGALAETAVSATSTAVAAQLATQSAAETATAEANQRATEVANAMTTILPNTSTPAPSLTPTPRPPATAILESTPTATNAETTVTGTPLPPSQPDVPLLQPRTTVQSVTLEFPSNNAQGRGKVRFAWRPNFDLTNEQGFELIFWTETEDPLIEGKGWGGWTKNLFTEIDFDALSIEPKTYNWGVRLVRVLPEYTNEGSIMLSEVRQFTYIRPATPPDAPTETDTAEPPCPDEFCPS